eukprot:1619949-Amphidinium_carterae.1
MIQGNVWGGDLHTRCGYHERFFSASTHFDHRCKETKAQNYMKEQSNENSVLIGFSFVGSAGGPCQCAALEATHVGWKQCQIQLMRPKNCPTG